MENLITNAYKTTHRASVVSIVGEERAPPVVSKGDHFYNAGWWTYMALPKFLVESTDQGKVDYEQASVLINKKKPKKTEIVIAETPENLSSQLAMALIGGSYHEALHTFYSRTGPISPQEIENLVSREQWSKICGIKDIGQKLANWYNVIEDIRIERNGGNRFSITSRMVALAELVHSMEGDPTKRNRHTTIACLFRDLGLGYESEMCLMGIEAVSLAKPETREFFDSKLGYLLEETKSLGEDDKDRPFAIAIEIVVLLGDIAEENLDIKTQSDAMTEAVKKEIEDQKAEDREGEAPWRPYTTELDQFVDVGGQIPDPSDSQKIRELETEAKQKVAFIRSKVRTMFLSLVVKEREYGVRKGKYLSEKYLVDTSLSLRDGDDPSRAWDDPGEDIDISTAVSIVVDESGSMKTKLADTKLLLVSIMEMLDQTGIKTEIIGIQSVDHKSDNESDDFHRSHPVRYNVYKTWSDNYRRSLWKLNKLSAMGSTPLADGLHIAISRVSQRKENKKIIILLTDGAPNTSHIPVIRKMNRVSRENGVITIAVGISQQADWVRLFRNWMQFKSVGEAIVPLIEKLEEELVRNPTRTYGAANGI